MLVERLDETIATAGRHTKYVKLWRVDGPISLGQWKELICHYYRDNRLVGEYLGGEDTVHVEQTPRYKRHLAEYLPCPMDSADGLLVLVAYHPKSLCRGTATVEVCPWQQWEAEGARVRVVEFSALDFIKLLKEFHSTTALPIAPLLIAYEDMDINLPLVVHRGPDASRMAGQTLDSIRQFVTTLAERRSSRFVTAQVGVEEEDRLITYCFAGSLEALAKAMPIIGPIPKCRDEVVDWCTQVQTTLHQTFPEAKYRDDYLSMIETVGALNLRRTMVPITTDQNGMQAFALPRNDLELIEAVRKKSISAVPCFEVKKAMCPVCQTNYVTCECKSFLEQLGTVSVTDGSLMGYTWTARPAMDIPLDVGAAGEC